MRKVLIQCTIVDGSGRPAIEDGCIVIDDNVITDIGSRETVLPDQGSFPGEVIKMKGWSILPGLMDMHIHLSSVPPWTSSYKMKSKAIPYITIAAAKRAMQILRAGITFMRVAGEIGHVDVGLKEVFESGMLPGPRLFVAGKGITSTGGHGFQSGKFWEADGPDEFRKISREELKLGADFIKILATGGIATKDRSVMSVQLAPAEIRAVVEVAHQAEKHVAAHATGPAGVIACVENGVDCIEHGFVLNEQAIDVMVKNKTTFCPTLTVTWAWNEDFLRANNYEEWVIEKANEAAQNHLISFQQAVKAGIPVVTGTDELPADYYDGSIALVKEIEIMASNGLSNMEAIQAATIHGAELCGMVDKLGTLEKGKWADLMAVEGNPIDDITALRNLRFVMKNGDIVFREGQKDTRW